MKWVYLTVLEFWHFMIRAEFRRSLLSEELLPSSARTWSFKPRQKTRGCRRLETSTPKEWGLLWRREWTLGFLKKWGVPWLAERLSASQEGISCKESMRTWLWWRLLSHEIKWAAVFMCLCLSCDHVGPLAQCTSETNPLKSVPLLEAFYCSVQLFFEFHIARQYFISGFETRCYRLCWPECDYYYYYHHHHHHYRLCCPVRDCHCILSGLWLSVYRVRWMVSDCQCIECFVPYVTASV